ncbi:MAG: hypothetical protein MIO88_04560, partial [Methanoregulaceae archaeon]|nr:hypothetical protein [Methanoregulaceae archaeon]
DNPGECCQLLPAGRLFLHLVLLHELCAADLLQEPGDIPVNDVATWTSAWYTERVQMSPGAGVSRNCRLV